MKNTPIPKKIIIHNRYGTYILPHISLRFLRQIFAQNITSQKRRLKLKGVECPIAMNFETDFCETKHIQSQILSKKICYFQKFSSPLLK